MFAELDERVVREALAHQLAAPNVEPGGVVWVKDGNEVVVWLDSIEIELQPGTVRFGVDLESDQTGRARQDVVIAVAEPSAPPSLLALSDATARGDVLLSARWGRTLQDAVWGALLELAGEDAVGIAAARGALVVQARDTV